MRNKKINLLICGISGRMGEAILDLVASSPVFSVLAGVCNKEADDFLCKYGKNLNVSIFKNFNEIAYTKLVENINAIVDFSSPKILDELLDFAVRNRLPTVIGTTGHSKEQINKIKLMSNEIPIFFSGNMSLGVNLLILASRYIASILKDNCDVEIIEKHHKNKKDAPSGTALMLAGAVSGELGISTEYIFNRSLKSSTRNRNEIGISSVRVGTVVGEHNIIFGMDGETLTLTHNAENRNIFAKGALLATKFIIEKEPGLYSMNNLCSCGLCY